MLPLENARAAAKNPELEAFYASVDSLRARYLRREDLKSLPSTLDEYLDEVVKPTLARQKAEGAIAVKFEAAYLRSLEFGDPSRERASSVFASFAAKGAPPADDYTALQDFLFREISRQAGQLGLPIHIHVGIGGGAFFNVAGSRPSLLESVLNDLSLRHTKFVLIHGGWPYAKETASLLTKPNVYADFSAMTFLLSSRELGEVLYTWLQWYPEKVLFGTDGMEFSPELGWEVVTLIVNRTGREALAVALSNLVSEGSATQERAIELAHMVMRENALHLYRLSDGLGKVE